MILAREEEAGDYGWRQNESAKQNKKLPAAPMGASALGGQQRNQSDG